MPWLSALLFSFNGNCSFAINKYPMEIIIGLSFLLSPFVIYYATRYAIHWIRKHIALGDSFSYRLLRPLYLILEVLLILVVLSTVFTFGQFPNWQSSTVLHGEFWFVWLCWPLTAAIYKETRIYKWEWLLFWSYAVFLIPWLWILFAFVAE